MDPPRLAELQDLARVSPRQSVVAGTQWSNPMPAALPSRSDSNLPAFHDHPGAVRESIARINDGELSAMERDDLIDLIRLSELSAPDASVEQRLHWASREELLRLAHLVRRCCRMRVDTWRRALGGPTSWDDAI
jgi:hypothetical protein